MLNEKISSVSFEPMLPHVEKPSRYLNHEWGAVEEQKVLSRFVWFYADVYEVGPALILGIAILTL